MGLWYLLASTYVVARLLCNRFLLGTWSVNAEFVVDSVTIPLVQLVVLEVLRLGRGAGSEAQGGAGQGPRAGQR